VTVHNTALSRHCTSYKASTQAATALATAQCRIQLGLYEAFHAVWLFKYVRLCGLVVRVPAYTTEMYCDSCEVQTEFIYVM
jgi:hypothetical protein